MESAATSPAPIRADGLDPVPCLVFVEGTGPLLGRRVTLAGETVIGRDPTCTVRLDADDVSRRHAWIAPDGDGHVLGDLGSLNGTFVNGQEIERRRLVPGDRIRVGPFVACYLSPRAS